MPKSRRWTGLNTLLARLDERKNCSEHLAELRAGRPVVVPASSRAHLTGLLKKESMFTRHKTVVAGQWVAFFPCRSAGVQGLTAALARGAERLPGNRIVARKGE